MIRFPNCKINLGLHILEKRTDGFHNLETAFYPLQIRDALEILPAPHLEKPELTLSGLPVAGDGNSNLCIKAWQIIKNDFPELPAVKIHLHKAIPMGAGLGGGSADGAFMLIMLNEQFNLYLPDETLARYALQLGSDCPFFIYNKPCFAAGRGEIIEPIRIDLSNYFFYIVNPNIHINTSDAFAQLEYQSHSTSIKEIVQLPIEKWKESLINDFEEGVAKKHPAISEIKQQLYNNGAVYAAMSGSGSTLFGIFKEKPQIIPFPESYFTKIISA